jgi:cyanuric acid amidohydrolase
MKVEVYKIPQNSPDDLSQLDALIHSGKIDPNKIVAILGKTEGNGCVNDFTRGFAIQTLKTYLRDKVNLEVAQRIVYMMSGGTEGVLSPHLNIFTRDEQEGVQRWGLAIGIRRTRDFLPTEIGTLAMVEEVAAGVEAAIADAKLNKSDVHFVQIKCPLIVSTQQVKASNSYQSMAYSRGASALGVAVAMGEIDLEQITATDICANYALYSRVASTSAGVELRNCEIIVLGNSHQSTSSFVIGHSVMQHALDREAICQAVSSTNQPIERIVNIFAKAEADPSGFILGRRHTMLDDSDINHTRMARAVVGTIAASVVQDPMVYVSGGSEHQGPPGGGPVAAIAFCGHD